MYYMPRVICITSVWPAVPGEVKAVVQSLKLWFGFHLFRVPDAHAIFSRNCILIHAHIIAS